MAQWSDPRIQNLNPALRLPAASFRVAILVPDANTYASGFSSGINSIFSAAMGHFSAEWKAICGSNPDSTTWPKPSNFVAYSTLDGLLSAMSQVSLCHNLVCADCVVIVAQENMLAYMWLDEASSKGIQYAYMQNFAGVVRCLLFYPFFILVRALTDR